MFDDRSEREIKADPSVPDAVGSGHARIFIVSILTAALIVAAAVTVAWLLY